MCILSAAFSCFFLSVAGVLGKVCGSHSNFSELVANVVDNPSTWGGRDSPQFPLARVILEEPRFPLTVGGLLEACGTNLSLFQALHLEQRYDLEERLMLSPQDKVSPCSSQARNELCTVFYCLSPSLYPSTLVENIQRRDAECFRISK